VEISHQRRLETWGKLAGAWRPDNLESLANEISLAEAPDMLRGFLKGTVRGRTLVNLLH
jgi:hypothetical protein